MASVPHRKYKLYSCPRRWTYILGDYTMFCCHPQQYIPLLPCGNSCLRGVPTVIYLDGEMWCYQKPGFEALILAELQRQQQCSQFCDTLLKTEGVSVPAHSCILSAISPHISSALSSTPPPPAGQTRLLEFRALSACTLLHMVRLLYCGEMAGEGEKEKQEAISAAAKLGIHGLVEVTKRGRKNRNEEGEGWHTEVGVQTEPLMPEENGGRLGRWRREVMDGSVFLWKETLSDGKKDTWTQTEEQETQMGPPSHPADSFETIDMSTLQSLGQTGSNLVPPEITCIPSSLVYPPDEKQTHQPSSVLVNSMQESTTAGHTSVAAPPYTFAPPPLPPFSSQATLCAADFQSWWAGPQGAARGVAAEWEDERLEQFEDNIPGYISYFLNKEKEEGSSRGRANRRRGAGAGGARTAGTGERRARRPQARARGRGRGGLTQTVDVQEVGVSSLQKSFLHRCGPSRTGQGGGAVGRKLCLNTRELLKSAKSCQGRRGRGKAWGGNTQCGRRRTTQQFNQYGLPAGRAPRARAKPTTSVFFPSSHMPFRNVQTLSAFSPSLQPSPSPGVLLPVASYVPPASSLLHSTSLPPPALPPHKEQPENIDHLLEAVMMGLDILPNNGAPHFQPPLPTSSSCAYTSSVNILAQNKQPGCTTGLLETSSGFHRATHVAVATGACSSSSEMPVLQQQGEGELTEMLDHFLRAFEQHVDSCTAREEVETGGQSCTEDAQSKYRNTPRPQNTHTPHPARCSQITEPQQRDEAETPLRCSQPRKASACSATPPKHTEGSLGKVGAPAKQRKRRRKNDYLFSLEKKRVGVRKSVSTRDTKTKIICDRRDEQLQQMPVVKLRRTGPLPAKVTLQKPGCLEVKSTAKTNTSSSSVKCPHDSWTTKTYPIRSRFRQTHNMDSVPFLEEPLQNKQGSSADQLRHSQGKRNKKGQLHSLSNCESSTTPVNLQPVEPRGMDEQLEKNQERLEELRVQPLEEVEGAARRGEKRGAESEEVTSVESTLAKRVCFEPTSETCIASSQSADFKLATRVIKEVLLTSVSECVQREDGEENKTQSEVKLKEMETSLMDEKMESSGDEIIDVDGDSEDDRCQSRTTPTLAHVVKVSPPVSPSSHSAKEVSLGSTGSWDEADDEDIDVIGVSSPAPDPVIISWTESSEGEEEEGDEDIDVVEEKTDYASSAVFVTVSTGELISRKYQTEVLLH